VTLLGEVDADGEPRLADLFVVSGEGAACHAETNVIASPSIFGGQLFGLAVMAAARSSEGAWIPVSLQAQLLDRGVAGSAIDIAVTNLRDGRSTLHRSLSMSQGGRSIAAVQVALEPLPPDAPRIPTTAPDPAITPPTASDTRSPFVARWGFAEVEVVHREPEAIHPLWVRPRVELPDVPALHAAAIAFISDMALVMVVHEDVGDAHATPLTVDHTIWFHGVPRFDDWLYLEARLSTRHDERGLVIATITDTRGNRMATVSQGVRVKRSRAAGPG
jgi:acyl-CoA thioesterase II